MTTRQKLIDVIAGNMQDIPKVDVAKAVEVAFDYIAEALIRAERVEIRGFGSFSTGEKIIAPSTNLSSVLYHYKKVRTINYRMPEGLHKKLNDLG